MEKKGIGEWHIENAHQVTKENIQAVMAMRLAGIPKNRIAKVLNIGTKTLDKYYFRYMALAKDEIDKMVVSKMLQKINEGDTKLIEFYLRTQKNWTDRQTHVVEHKVTKTREEIEEELLALGVSPEKLKEI